MKLESRIEETKRLVAKMENWPEGTVYRAMTTGVVEDKGRVNGPLAVVEVDDHEWFLIHRLTGHLVCKIFVKNDPVGAFDVAEGIASMEKWDFRDVSQARSMISFKTRAKEVFGDRVAFGVSSMSSDQSLADVIAQKV